MLDFNDERELAYEYATPGPLVVIMGGQIVHTRAVGREEADESDDE